MPEPRVAAIASLADDLTGALEIGAKFAGAGIAATVTTEFAWDRDVPASVIDTETRHASPQAAAKVVQRLAREADGVRLIYKKTDSTLRGNIGAELAALASAFPGSRIVYAPAYPKMGRTVRKGILLVNGVPVHNTAFAHDPLNPVLASDVVALTGEVAHVTDAETDDDIARAAEDLLRTEGLLLAAGPAAFAEAIADRIDVRREPAPVFPKAPRCLVVNGSLHPLARQQAAIASEGGWVVINDGAPGVGQRVRCLADSFDALIIFGGDTAFDILRVLGATLLRPIGEIVPGVPLSLARYGGRDLIIMTKAGGFGPVDILATMRSLL